MSSLHLRTYTALDKTIVSTRGDIDLTNSALLDAHLMSLSAQGRRHLVINLSHTVHVDSTGLAALVRAHKALNADGGALAVVGCRPSVSRVLHLVGLHHLFPIEDHRMRGVRSTAA